MSETDALQQTSEPGVPYSIPSHLVNLTEKHGVYTSIIQKKYKKNPYVCICLFSLRIVFLFVKGMLEMHYEGEQAVQTSNHINDLLENLTSSGIDFSSDVLVADLNGSDVIGIAACRPQEYHEDDIPPGNTVII